MLLAEHVVGGRDPVSLLAWGFLFASVFWAVLVPWWTFPPHALTDSTSLHGHLHAVSLPVWVLAAWMIVLGTIVPFFLLVSALRHLSATRVGIVAMLEPVAGALVAWIWLAEGLGGVSSSAPASCWPRSCWRRRPDSASLQENRLQIPRLGEALQATALSV